MFGFFVDGEFKGMWGNKIGDIFYNATVEKLEWDITKTVLVHYDVKNSEMRIAFFHEFFPNELVLKDELGNIIKTIPAELFAENGLLHKAC
jgi:hypothetical protein